MAGGVMEVPEAERAYRSCTVSAGLIRGRSAAFLAELRRVALFAVVLGMEDGLALHQGAAVVTSSAGLACHDVLHGELISTELAFLLEHLVVVATFAG